MNEYDLVAISGAMKYLRENIQFTHDKDFINTIKAAELTTDDESILLGLKLLKERFSKNNKNP